MLNERWMDQKDMVVVLLQSSGHVWLSETQQTSAHQASLSFTISFIMIKFMSIESLIPSTNLSSAIPFFSCTQSFQVSRSFSVSLLFSLYGKSLEFQLQYQSFQWIFTVDSLYDWLICSPCCPRNSQQSSPLPEFKSINSSALSLLYGPTLTFIHEYWKSHSFDYLDLCQQSDVSSF